MLVTRVTHAMVERTSVQENQKANARVEIKEKQAFGHHFISSKQKPKVRAACERVRTE